MIENSEIWMKVIILIYSIKRKAENFDQKRLSKIIISEIMVFATPFPCEALRASHSQDQGPCRLAIKRTCILVLFV